MIKTNCDTVRRELDETNLGEESSSSAMLHLQQCVECSEFHQSRTKLRQLVGSLGTIEAPADFDFRLRARLAGEKSPQRRVFLNWSPGLRALAAAAIVLMVGVIILISQLGNQPPNSVVKVEDTPARLEPVKTEPIDSRIPKAIDPRVIEESSAGTTEAGRPRRKASAGPELAEVRAKRQLATKEFSSVSAPRFQQEESVADAGFIKVFPIGSANQSLRVSLEDGNGNWRTISLPPVSFGSQRVVATGSVSNQLAAKGIW